MLFQDFADFFLMSFYLSYQWTKSTGIFAVYLQGLD